MKVLADLLLCAILCYGNIVLKLKPILHTTQCRDSMGLTLSLVPLIGSPRPFNNSWRLSELFFCTESQKIRSAFDALSALSFALYTYIMPNFRPLAADVPHTLHGPSTLGISLVSYV